MRLKDRLECRRREITGAPRLVVVLLLLLLLLSWTLLARNGETNLGLRSDGSETVLRVTALGEPTLLEDLLVGDLRGGVVGGSWVAIRLGLESRGGNGTTTTEGDFRGLGGSSSVVGRHCISSILQEIKSLIKSSVLLLQLGQGTRIRDRRLAFQRLKHF